MGYCIKVQRFKKKVCPKLKEVKWEILIEVNKKILFIFISQQSSHQLEFPSPQIFDFPGFSLLTRSTFL